MGIYLLKLINLTITNKYNKLCLLWNMSYLKILISKIKKLQYSTQFINKTILNVKLMFYTM